MKGHKTNLNKFKKIKIISNIFQDHNRLKLETNFNEKIQKYSNSWRLNSMLVNIAQVNNEVKEEIKKFLETNENEHMSPKLMGPSEGILEREVHSDTRLPKKHRNISNKQPNHTPQRTRRTKTKTAQSKQKEGNTQDQIRIKQHRE